MRLLKIKKKNEKDKQYSPRSVSRRRVFQYFGIGLTLLLLVAPLRSIIKKGLGSVEGIYTKRKLQGSGQQLKPFLGVEKDGLSKMYCSRDLSPEDNMNNILEMMGGVESIVDKHDIVVLKPNAQWWYQGMTNTNTMKAFIEKTLKIRGFEGEIIIAENHQYADPDSRGWTTDKRNGDFNLNELVDYFQSRGFKNVTKYHWQCAGPNPRPIEGDASLGSKIVKGPWEGDGYVWRDDIVHVSPLGRRCMLTYPIFTSRYSGVTVDFKEGAWKNGEYTHQPVKFINFSALNHHSFHCGVTASVKNYMGIVDMSCGFQGSTPKGYYNTHFIGLRDLHIPFAQMMPFRIRKALHDYEIGFFNHTGEVLGAFMRDIRFADLNIITAHWVGWGSRTKKEYSAYPRTVLASRDPVALDYIACRDVLYPLTKEYAKNQALVNLHNVEDKKGPFYRFLESCHKMGVGNIDPGKHSVIGIQKS